MLEIYARKDFQFFQDVKPLFAVTMAPPHVPRPTDPSETAFEMDKIIWKENVKPYCIRTNVLIGNMAALFAVIRGQCSESMKAKVKATRDYKAESAAYNCYWALKQIKSVTLQFDEKRNAYIALLDTTANFVNLHQAQYQQLVNEYVDMLRGFADTIEYHGGTVVRNFQLVPKVDDIGNTRMYAEHMSIARDKTMASTLIYGRADPTRFGTLICHLANQFANGMDKYPEDFGAGHSLLESYSSPSNTRPRLAQQTTQTHTVLRPPPRRRVH